MEPLETAQWVDVGAAAALADSEPWSLEVDGIPVVIVRCGTDLYAVEDRCTHDGEPLGEAEVEACRIVCPRHGAQFCLRTGAALTPPAYEPLRTWRVRDERGRILIERPQ